MLATRRISTQNQNSRPNSFPASTTALYPLILAWLLNASYVCPLLNVRGIQSMANAVDFWSWSCWSNSGFWAGYKKEMMARFSSRVNSSLLGGRNCTKQQNLLAQLESITYSNHKIKQVDISTHLHHNVTPLPNIILLDNLGTRRFIFGIAKEGWRARTFFNEDRKSWFD